MSGEHWWLALSSDYTDVFVSEADALAHVRASGEPAAVIEIVPVEDLRRAVQAERTALGAILKADRGDWDRTIPTLAQWARARLRELDGGQ